MYDSLRISWGVLLRTDTRSLGLCRTNTDADVHWVKGWSRDSNGGDRYSLIFYDTSDRHPTPILPLGVDSEYLLPAAALEDEEDATTRRLEDLVV